MKAGHHTPKETSATLDKLNKLTPFKWSCSSWKNDAADSLKINLNEEGTEYYFLSLPNKAEEFKNYYLTYFNEYDNEEKEILDTPEISEIINYFNN